MKMKFAWDANKEKANKQKHRVSFTEACFVFSDKYALTMFDNEHSTEEERWVTMGQAPNGKVLLVFHTYRNIDGVEFVRIISARKAAKKESKQYYERRP